MYISSLILECLDSLSGILFISVYWPTKISEKKPRFAFQVIGTEEGVEHLLGCRVEAVDAEGRSLLLAKECRHVTVQGRWLKHG